jgi:subtilisin-like proprotein convertase family protein
LLKLVEERINLIDVSPIVLFLPSTYKNQYFLMPMKKKYQSLDKLPSNSFQRSIFRAIVGLLFMGNCAIAQVNLLAPSDGGFENSSTTFQDNGWTVVQGTDNRLWRVGTIGGSNSGVNAAYTGTLASYNGLNLERVNHFYRDVAIPAGATNVQLSFAYRQPTIDNTYDYFYASVTDVATFPAQDVAPGAAFNILFSNTGVAYAGFTQIGPFDLTSLAGTTIRLVFSAEADGVTPAANPAVDDIILSYIPSGYNMGISSIAAPVLPACYTNNETISVTVVNDGNQDLDLSINPLTIDASISGPNPVSFTPVILNSGIFTAGSSQTVVVSSGYDMSATGVYVVSATTTVTGDADAGNDTFTANYEKFDNPNGTVTPDVSAFCIGGSVNLFAEPLTVAPSVSLSNNNATIIPDANANGVNSVISVVSASAANEIVSCTVNINHTYTGDLTLVLTAPDGSFVTLAAEVGAGGINFTNTVFTDTALVPIANGTAPFTGYFNPQDAFAGLSGSANGNWTLNVADNAFLDDGSIISWSINFPAPNAVASYAWSPASGLSSTAIPDPVANPTTTTTYTVTLTDNIGCTGTGTALVTVHPTYNINQSLTLCTGDTLTIGNSVYTTVGNYTDVLTTVFGCDSIVNSNLTFNLPSLAYQSFNLCSGDTVPVGSNFYTTTGVYTDVLLAANGCDSTVTTDLTFIPSATASQSFVLCAGDSLVVGVNTYIVSGIYSNVFIAANGCDSTVTTDLTILPDNILNQSFSICGGDSINVGNNAYTITGIYTDLFVSVLGCDSTVITDLTVNANIGSNQSFSICFGDSVVVGNDVYNSSGVYTNTFISFTGCDSIVTTNLVVNSIINVNQTISICAGDSLMVGNSMYGSSGIYTDSLIASTGCDSIVTTDLTVLNALSSSQSPIICAGASFAVGNNTYTTSGTYTDVLLSSAGCDSTVTTNLTVNALPNVSLATFTEPFCIQAASYVLSGGTPSGGTYSGSGISTSPNFNPAGAGLGNHTIIYSFTDANACTASATQSLTVTDCTGLEELGFAGQINIYPNPNKGEFFISIDDANFQSLQISLYDQLGREIYSNLNKEVFGNFNKHVVLEDVAVGIYLLRLSNGEKMSSFRIIID